ncbi:hypothetical protein SDJN02_04853, partial [Cucurbita argyrosperma subsp. argyrosperma]
MICVQRSAHNVLLDCCAIRASWLISLLYRKVGAAISYFKYSGTLLNTIQIVLYSGFILGNPVKGSDNELCIKSLSPVSQTSQNCSLQLGGSIASVPSPGALSFDPSFCASCQSTT